MRCVIWTSIYMIFGSVKFSIWSHITNYIFWKPSALKVYHSCVILKILKGKDEDEYCFNEYSENEENIDDEVYPNSSTELHLTLALLGVDDDSTSCSSTDQNYSENLKDQWSMSLSFN